MQFFIFISILIYLPILIIFHFADTFPVCHLYTKIINLASSELFLDKSSCFSCPNISQISNMMDFPLISFLTNCTLKEVTTPDLNLLSMNLPMIEVFPTPDSPTIITYVILIPTLSLFLYKLN